MSDKSNNHTPEPTPVEHETHHTEQMARGTCDMHGGIVALVDAMCIVARQLERIADVSEGRGI